MLKISVLNRTTKASGQIRLRFRIRDGRKYDLTFKSDIIADLQDLSKIDSEGEPRPRVVKYNLQLCQEIKEMRERLANAFRAAATKGVPVTPDLLLLEYNKQTQGAGVQTMQERFESYFVENARAGVIGPSRQSMYKVLSRVLYRFLTINKLQAIGPADFDPQMLLEFRDFVENEYKHAAKYPDIYADAESEGAKVPTAPRSANTIAKYLKMLQAFFSELESYEEIAKSPFRLIKKDKKQKIMRERYAAPVYLYADELQMLINKRVPQELQDTKDAFVLQCLLGCRVGDFSKLKLENISTAKEGFYFVHYLPEKTAENSKDFAEVETPLVRAAADILARRGFSFPILKNHNGRDGYNSRIKLLLQDAGVHREITQHDAKTGANVYVPIYEIASSKTARKSFVDILAKVQINPYVGGVHKEGSGAVKHYTQLELKDRYNLMCQAFSQTPYQAGHDVII